MDTQSTFRKVIANKYLPGFDYINTKFSFKMVFHKSFADYSYCCCPCGVEHELFEYIHTKAKMNEEILERIVSNVTRGQCQHVSSVPEEYIQEAGIYAIHIACVVGTCKAVQHFLKNHEKRHGVFFNLNPFQTALLKGNEETVSLFSKLKGDKYYFQTEDLFLGQTFDQGRFRLQRLNIMHMLIQRKNSFLIKYLLNPRIAHASKTVMTAFQFSLDRQNSHLQKDIFFYLTTCKDISLGYFVKCCAEVAILHNDPGMLTKLLDQVVSGPLDTDYRKTLYDTCKILNRKECHAVLCRFQYYGDKSHFQSKLSEHVKRLVCLFAAFYDGFKDELRARLRSLLGYSGETKEPELWFYRESLLHVFLKSYDIFVQRYCNSSSHCALVKEMLALGGDIDNLDSKGNTPLMHIVSQPSLIYLPANRDVLELLIYENSDVDLNKTAVQQGIQTDLSRRERHHVGRMFLPGDYLMDSREHSLHGYDEPSNYALNFTGPLLIEAGFQVTKETLEWALERPLHPSVKEYFESCLANPRSLKLSCRDTLRSRFKGRTLRSYLEFTKPPASIKRFILLETLLKNIDFKD